MARGRQYYDPIIQVPGRVEGAPDMSRIELYPEGAADDPNPKWRGRRVNPDGSVSATAPGDFDHDRALAQAQQMWPDLTVYELRAEGEDSTWEGHGPSPRLWQSDLSPIAANPPDGPLVSQHKNEVDAAYLPPIPPDQLRTIREAVAEVEQTSEQTHLRVLPISVTGNYVLLDDICVVLETWAAQFDEDKNPSGALALRGAVDALKEIG